MIIHLTPRCYTESNSIQLDSIEIPELSVFLSSSELRTTTPYPNEKYKVGSLVKSDSTVGLILVSQNHVKQFKAVFTWVDSSTDRVFTHEVTYTINDFDYGAVSDSSCLWGASSRGFASRWIDGQAEIPLLVNPRLDITPSPIIKRDNCTDIIDADKKVIVRKQSIVMPSIEPERLKERKPYDEPFPLEGLEVF